MRLSFPTVFFYANRRKDSKVAKYNGRSAETIATYAKEVSKPNERSIEALMDLKLVAFGWHGDVWNDVCLNKLSLIEYPDRVAVERTINKHSPDHAFEQIPIFIRMATPFQ